MDCGRELHPEAPVRTVGWTKTESLSRPNRPTSRFRPPRSNLTNWHGRSRHLEEACGRFHIALSALCAAGDGKRFAKPGVPGRCQDDVSLRMRHCGLQG